MQGTVYSEDGVTFNFDCPEECGDGNTYFSGNKRIIPPSRLLDSQYLVDRLLEDMEEALYDEVGEVAEGNIIMSEASKNRLMDIISNYIESNVTVNAYGVDDIEEHTHDTL